MIDKSLTRHYVRVSRFDLTSSAAMNGILEASHLVNLRLRSVVTVCPESQQMSYVPARIGVKAGNARSSREGKLPAHAGELEVAIVSSFCLRT